MPWFEGPRCCLSLGPVWMAKPILENLAKPAIFWRTGSIGFLKFSQISTWVHNISTCPSTLNPLHSCAQGLKIFWSTEWKKKNKKKKGELPKEDLLISTCIFRNGITKSVALLHFCTNFNSVIIIIICYFLCIWFVWKIILRRRNRSLALYQTHGTQPLLFSCSL